MSVRPVILAEDNDKLRRLYTELLEAAGYKVMSASDGEKVIGLLHKIVKPKLVILDVMMPRVDGIEACRRIRNMQGLRSCPILFVTALDNPQTMLECLEAGGDDFIMKTSPVTEIVERVHYWARRGDSDENADRRQRAIRELEAMITRSEAERRRLDAAVDAEAEPTLRKLTAFVACRMANFAEVDLIHRFGYLVGLFEAYAPLTISDEQALHYFLRKLIFKTGFIDPLGVDALLGNYQRLVRQSQFQKGWRAGCDDAPLIEESTRVGQNKAEAAICSEAVVTSCSRK